MKYIVAVSGGVDSVVLLDKLAREATHDITVAHFDHGIRTDSAEDARFVKGLARKYHFPFVSIREDLGKGASEELARRRRYAFLRKEAKVRGATIVTAHHADDVIETIAINLIRGTGWRGLAVLSASDVVRPLIGLTKKEIYQYANERRLEWMEDSTNRSGVYLRNRLRGRMADLAQTQREQVLNLWRQQQKLAEVVAEEVFRLLPEGEYDRHLFIYSDEPSAMELLRAAILKECHRAPTRPQLKRALLAIKAARAGATLQVGDGIILRFTIRTFIVVTS